MKLKYIGNSQFRIELLNGSVKRLLNGDEIDASEINNEALENIMALNCFETDEVKQSKKKEYKTLTEDE